MEEEPATSGLFYVFAFLVLAAIIILFMVGLRGGFGLLQDGILKKIGEVSHLFNP